MLRKQIWAPVLLLVLAMVLAACPAPAPAQPSAPAAEPAAETTDAVADDGVCAPATEGEWAGVDPRGQTVVFWHQHSGARQDALSELVGEFNASNECGITVDEQNQGGYDDIRDKMNASIVSGEVPANIIVGYQNDQAFYQLNDALVDFNRFVDDPHWGLTAEERADFFPSFFDQSVHPVFDNQRLGFPPNRSVEVLYYNQSWLEELGFDGPPVTPDDFREMACAATEANGDGTGGFILRDDASAVAAWTYAFGGDVLAEDGTSYVYDGEATVEAMTFLKQLYDDGCAYFYTDGPASPEFAARRALFAMGSSSGLPFYRADVETIAAEAGNEPDEWGVSAIPHTTDEPVMNVYGGDVMIPVTTPEAELAAWVFVDWYTSPEIQARWNVASNYFPTRAASGEFLADTIAENAQYGQAFDLLAYATYEPQLISYSAVRNRTAEVFNEIMQGAEVESTLADLTAFANETEEELMSEIE
ncbi:MAG: extracellular solute-binding protein [Litorilinea sp.]